VSRPLGHKEFKKGNRPFGKNLRKFFPVSEGLKEIKGKIKKAAKPIN